MKLPTRLKLVSRLFKLASRIGIMLDIGAVVIIVGPPKVDTPESQMGLLSAWPISRCGRDARIAKQLTLDTLRGAVLYAKRIQPP